MKTLVTVFLLFVSLGVAQAQQKGDNLIIIPTTTTDEENFTDFGRFIVENGFSIENSSKDFLNITTGKKEAAWAHYFLNVSFKDGDIIIRPVMWGDTALGETQIEWEYRKSGLYKHVYLDILDWLPAYGEITYNTKK